MQHDPTLRERLAGTCVGIARELEANGYTVLDHGVVRIDDELQMRIDAIEPSDTPCIELHLTIGDDQS